jgi:hypothetical protein
MKRNDIFHRRQLSCDQCIITYRQNKEGKTDEKVVLSKDGGGGEGALSHEIGPHE